MYGSAGEYLMTFTGLFPDKAGLSNRAHLGSQRDTRRTHDGIMVRKKSSASQQDRETQLI